VTNACLERRNRQWYDSCDSCLPAMQSAAASAKIFRFGLFEANAVSGTLSRSGVRVKLQDQPFRVLIVLLERAGEIVGRDELRQNLWPDGTYVDFDGSLNAVLKKLRAAIDDDSDNPRFIETVPRRGYRFIAPVSFEPNPSSVVTTVPEEAPRTSAAAAGPGLWQNKRIWLSLATIIVLMSLGWRFAVNHPRTAAASQKVIAVLPFQNEGAGPDLDYLRYAIANDLVMDLSHTYSVSVRPFASTSKYGSQPVDPATAGAELRVTHVVAGGFLLEKNELAVTLELVDIAKNQPVWQEEIRLSPQNLVQLHDKLSERAVRGLLPAMNISQASTDRVPIPRNEEALELFLHSITVPLDPEPNQTAIQQLERSVSLVSHYAPAWGELGWRYYIDYHYGNGGESTVAKALDAYKHESELDPDWPQVSTTIRVEQGDLEGAHDQAAAFLQKHPNTSLAHYAMSYVLRYAGLLDEAGKQCDKAVAIDPGFNVFRSCATAFTLQGDYQHARIYIRLDENSGVAALYRTMIALRTGDTKGALAESGGVSQSGYQFVKLLRLYLNHATEAELSKAAAEVELDPRSSRDAEELYRNAEILSFCRRSEAALRELQKAIHGSYCAYPAMDKDPLLDGIRSTPEFAGLRQAAIECQQSFLAHRRQMDPAYAAK
jgi:DNA-binding winged helix-turn-helix (wHTH) protein/TolB-like protein